VHAITLLTNARLHDDLVRYASAAELVVLPAVNPRHIAPTDFGHAGQLITLAQAEARTVLTVRAPERLTGWRLPERGSHAGTRGVTTGID